ncbi:hypothetical protein FH5T_03045 [Draconibacterium orientale]|uniref:Uncharacterized protein n=1 Tax=Draconibacterium orientale TaxID=1168034 RepID=A0ABN4D5S5_9BACT|nr:hypothetical protein FH5T_03045 [Draconibacterium orientale]
MYAHIADISGLYILPLFHAALSFRTLHKYKILRARKHHLYSNLVVVFPFRITLFPTPLFEIFCSKLKKMVYFVEHEQFSVVQGTFRFQFCVLIIRAKTKEETLTLCQFKQV